MSPFDMAEDGLPDDRKACRDCAKCDLKRRRCAVFDHNPILDLKRRCVQFVPRPGDPDQRTGRERWPDIQAQIEEIRALDTAHAQRRS
jgi:hypothetical protein